MKRMLSFSLAILICVSFLSGCGSKGSATSSGDTNGKKTVTLSFVSWMNEKSYKPIIDAFAKVHPEIKLDIQYAPPVQAYVDKLKVIFTSGESPDLFYTAAENRDEVATQGYAEDISDLPIISKISKMSTDYYSNNGKIFAFSPDAWIGGIFYNKKLFAKAGITVLPNSWSDLMDDMKKLKDKGITPMAENKDAVYNLIFSLYTCDVINGDINYDKEINSKKKTYTEGYTKSIQTWYTDAVKTGYISKEMLGTTSDQATTQFITEKAAMMFGGPWNITDFKTKNPDLQYDMMPLVGTTPGVKWNLGAVNVGLSIGAKSTHKAEAKEFINFLGSPEGLKLYQAMTGNVMLVDGVDYTIDPAIAQFKDKAIKGQFYLPNVYWGHSAAIFKEFTKGSQDVISGVSKPDAVTKTMDAKKAELDAAGVN